MDAHEAAAHIRPTDVLSIGLGPAQPGGLLDAMAERDDWVDLRVYGALLVGGYALFTRPGTTLLAGFYGPLERMLLAQGHDVQFVPADFRGFTRCVEHLKPRVIGLTVAPPDAHGQLSLSLHAGAGVADLYEAMNDPDRLVIAEINPHAPRTVGLPPDHPHSMPIDAVDVVYETDRPLFEIDEPPPSDVDIAIAAHCRHYVHDGSTLQSGIGGIPNEVMKLLSEGDGGDYGVHSEMFTTGLMRLHKAGKVTNKKGFCDGFSPTTFAAGTRELYDWLDGNEEVRFVPVEHVNDPALIARNRSFISINGALSIDLQGQIVADSIQGDQYSGIGGHMDFVSGAIAAPGGHSLVCLPSTAGSTPKRISRIVPRHPAGTLITTPRHQTDVIITEFGAAELANRSVNERAEALIEVAHPDVRDALRAAWRDGGETLPEIASEPSDS